MSEAVNPYKVWLGIADSQQVLDNYRLLGLRLHENRLESIQDGGERQISKVRAHLQGPHARIARRLIAEIQSAVACLSDADTRAEYDSWLKSGSRHAKLPEESTKTKGEGLSRVNKSESETSDEFDLLSDDFLAEAAAYESQAQARPARVPNNLENTRTIPTPSLRGPATLFGSIAGLFALVAFSCWYFFESGRPSVSVADRQSVDTHKAHSSPLTSNNAPSSKSPLSPKPFHPVPGNTPPVQAEVKSAQPTTPTTQLPSGENNFTDKPSDPAVNLAANDNPFEHLPQYLNLPEPKSATSVVTAGILVGELLLDKPSELSIAISGAVDLYPHEEWSLIPTAGISSWKCKYRKSIKSKSETAVAKNSSIDVANIRVVDNKLWIEWEPSAFGAEEPEHLRNLVLHLRYHNHAHFLRMRAPTITSPLVLDASRTQQSVSLTKNKWDPELSQLKIQITKVDGLPQSIVGNIPIEIQGGGKTTIILRQESPQVALQISFIQIGQAAVLRIEPQVIENGQVSIPFTTERMATMARTLPSEINRSRQDYALATANASAVQNDIRRVASMSTNNLVDENARQVQLDSLQGTLSKLLTRIKSLNDSIPAMERRLSILPAMIKLADGIHEKVVFHFRLLYSAAGQEVDVYVAQGLPGS